MRRPKRRKLKENLVEMAVNILEDEVDPIYGRKRHLKRLYIHKQENNTYFKLIIKIVDYLEELRGEYRNQMKDLLKDYFTAIHERFLNFNRYPSLHNFSPSTSNKIAFEEFIHKIEVGCGEQYWTNDDPVYYEIIHVPVEPEFTPLSISEV